MTIDFNCASPSSFIDDGLAWDWDPDCDWWQVYAMDPFTVDGITYSYFGPNVHVRSMISLEPAGGEPARMYYSAPPTEQELDEWVEHCRLPGPPGLPGPGIRNYQEG